MQKLKRTKYENFILGVFFIEAIIITLSFLISSIDYNIPLLSRLTQTQISILTFMGFIYIVMNIGVIFWQEWAMYGLISTKLIIVFIIVIKTRFNIFGIIGTMISFIITIYLCIKLVVYKIDFE